MHRLKHLSDKIRIGEEAGRQRVVRACEWLQVWFGPLRASGSGFDPRVDGGSFEP